MTDHVLAFALGPVQGFIAAARKGVDLWAGSQLLSDVCTAAALAAAEHPQAELVAPAASAEDLRSPRYAVANKLLVLVRGDGEAAAAVEQAMESAAREELAERARAVLDALPARSIHRDLADRQVAELLELAWVALPFDRDAGDGAFTSACTQAERALAGLKACRPFTQPGPRHGNHRSSLDPALDSVVDAKLYKDDDGQALYRQLGARRGERLSGVDLFKRHYRPDAADRVPSTSHIASYSLRRAWIEAEPETQASLAACFERYRRALSDLGADVRRLAFLASEPVLRGVDAHALYDTRLPDLGIAQADVPAAERHLRELLHEWREILGDAYRPLSPYYALLMGDGDHVGAALSVLGISARQRASRLLAAFAVRARDVVAAGAGHCIYAGGDDVLAILPAQRALGVALDLRGAFQEEVAQRLDLPQGSQPLSFSAGVCVAHHLDPISDALAGARAAENAAKQVYGRDALVIATRKRNGAPRSLGMKWDDTPALVEMQALLDGNGPDALPRGLPYALRATAARVATTAAERSPVHDAMLRSLARGVAMQKRLGPQAISLLAVDRPGAFDLDRLADQLEVARTLAALDGGRA